MSKEPIDMSATNQNEHLKERLRERAKLENVSVEALLERWLDTEPSHGSTADHRQMQLALQERELQFRTLVQDSPVAMLVSYDFGEKVDFLNDKFIELFGYTTEDMPDVTHWWLLAYPDPAYREKVKKQWSEQVKHAIEQRGRTEPLEVHVACKDNSTRYVEVQLVSIGHKHLVTFVDLTKRRQTEQALRESEKRYSVIASLILSYACAYRYLSDDNDTAQLEWVVGAFEEITGHTIEDALNSFSLSVPVHPDDVPLFRERQHKLHSGQADTREFRILDKYGAVHCVRSYGLPEWDADHQRVIRVYIGVQDITELKNLQEQAFALAVERERANVLSEFVRGASHEFRTPLTIIQTSLYMITRTTDTEKRQRAAVRAAEQIARLTRLLDMMLILTRLDGDVLFNFEIVNINRLIQQIVTDKQRAITGKTLLVQFAPDPTLTLLRVDQSWLAEALSQILENAVRFTPECGTVTLRTYAQQDRIAIEVQDTGTGISVQALPHIFERFWRQDAAHSTLGFGLGLSIAQKIIECHGGTIEVESVVGNGSLFRILLPRPSPDPHSPTAK